MAHRSTGREGHARRSPRSAPRRQSRCHRLRSLLSPRRWMRTVVSVPAVPAGDGTPSASTSAAGAGTADLVDVSAVAAPSSVSTSLVPACVVVGVDGVAAPVSAPRSVCPAADPATPLLCRSRDPEHRRGGRHVSPESPPAQGKAPPGRASLTRPPGGSWQPVPVPPPAPRCRSAPEDRRTRETAPRRTSANRRPPRQCPV